MICNMEHHPDHQVDITAINSRCTIKALEEDSVRAWECLPGLVWIIGIQDSLQVRQRGQNLGQENFRMLVCKWSTTTHRTENRMVMVDQ